MDDNTITPQAPVINSQPEISDGIDFDPKSFGDSIVSRVEAKFPELVDQISQKTKDEIVNRIIGEQKKDEKWVPGSYEEILERATKEALTAFEKKQADMQARQAEEQKVGQTKAQEIIEANNKYWDNQITELEKDSLLPEMSPEIVEKLAAGKTLTEEEQQDPGVSARAELYAKSKELKDGGDADWWNLKYVAYKFGVGGQRPGANAPVMRGGNYVQEGSRQGYSYDEIHNQSFQAIAKGGK